MSSTVITKPKTVHIVGGIALFGACEMRGVLLIIGERVVNELNLVG